MSDYLTQTRLDLEAAAARMIDAPRRRRLRAAAGGALAVVAAAAAVGIVTVGGSSGSNERAAAGGPPAKTQKGPPFDLAAAQRTLAGAPAPLADLHAHANQILTGDLQAFNTQIAALKGYPIVVNKWGSWCVPCRSEFPIFERVSTALGKKVAFVGVDGRDATDEATSFLNDFPVPYPSYRDFDENIARSIHAPNNYPITIFIDRHGKVVIPKQGIYTQDKTLRADIKRYLGV